MINKTSWLAVIRYHRFKETRESRRALSEQVLGFNRLKIRRGSSQQPRGRPTWLPTRTHLTCHHYQSHPSAARSLPGETITRITLLVSAGTSEVSISKEPTIRATNWNLKASTSRTAKATQLLTRSRIRNPKKPSRRQPILLVKKRAWSASAKKTVRRTRRRQHLRRRLSLRWMSTSKLNSWARELSARWCWRSTKKPGRGLHSRLFTCQQSTKSIRSGTSTASETSYFSFRRQGTSLSLKRHLLW